MWSRHDIRGQWHDHTSSTSFFTSPLIFSHTQHFPVFFNPRGMNQNSIKIFYHLHEPVLVGLSFSSLVHAHIPYCTHADPCMDESNQIAHTCTRWFTQMDSALKYVHHIQCTHTLRSTHTLYTVGKCKHYRSWLWLSHVYYPVITWSYQFRYVRMFISLCPHTHTYVPVYLCASLSVCICWHPGALPCQSAEPGSYLTSNSQIGKPLCFWFEARKVV